MRKVLFVNSAGNPKYDAISHIKPFLKLPYQIVNAETEELPINCREYSHVILGGSVAPSYESIWQNKLYRWVCQLIETDIPILGICYGHQIIVRSCFGKKYLIKREYENIGWGCVTVSSDDFLLGEIGDKWVPFAFHGYELEQVPEEYVKVIASSEQCNIMSYKFKEKNIWGFQPHFEINDKQAVSLLRNFNITQSTNNNSLASTWDKHYTIFEKFFTL